MNSAIAKLSTKSNFPRKSDCRFVPTLRYLKDLGIRIATPDSSCNMAMNVVAQLHEVLQETKGELVVYTDGSSCGADPNSGAGIYLTDTVIVRSDGNNFIAELAAAAVVLQACPPNRRVSFHLDSLVAL